MLNNNTIYKFIVKNNKLNKMKYQPISCSLYDRIESLSVLKKKVEINYIVSKDDDKSTSGIINNIFSKDGAEFIELNNTIIRLDMIKSISEI